MDPVTHACVGYCAARASTAASHPVAAASAGLVATLPDLDLVVQPLLGPASAFAFHRGPLHSLPIALVVGLAIAPLVARIAGVPLRRAAVLGVIAMMSHGLLDYLTGFGTALWWPFTQVRYSAELLFVVDPLVTLPLLLACGMDLFGPRGWRDHSQRLALAAIVLVLGYIGFAATIRGALAAGFRHQLERDGLTVEAIHAEPTAGGALLWYFCADTGERYHMLYRSALDGESWERARHLPVQREALHALREDPVAAVMLNIFGRWYTCVDQDGAAFAVIDVRLGPLHGWASHDAPMLFRYQIEPGPEGLIGYARAPRTSTFDRERLSVLAWRALGRIPARLRTTAPDGGHHAP